MKIRSALSLVILSAMLAGHASAADNRRPIVITDQDSCIDEVARECAGGTAAEQNACIDRLIGFCHEQYPEVRKPLASVKNSTGIGSVGGIYQPPAPPNKKPLVVAPAIRSAKKLGFN